MGAGLFPVLAAIPLVGWARYSLGQHSPRQLAAGFGLAVVIAVPILYSLGLLRNVVMQEKVSSYLLYGIECLA